MKEPSAAPPGLELQMGGGDYGFVHAVYRETIVQELSRRSKGASCPGLMDEAVREFRASRERMRHFVPVYAWETYDLARALRKRGAAGDREEARPLLDEAIQFAEQRGMPPIAERAREELALLEASGRAYPNGLTPREAEILGLVAAGRMDKEIAHELHITVKTASNHVGNIFRKIGAGNRTEAARYAMQHGLSRQPVVRPSRA